MDALKSLVQPLIGSTGSSSIVDGMKLVVLGGTVETARRISSSAWTSFVNSFFLTAHFSEEDYPFDWLMLWLSRRPEWQRSREFETTTRTTTPSISSNIPDNSFDNEDDESLDADSPGRQKTRVVFQPTFDSTHTIYYKGHWLRVKRSRKSDNSDVEVLSISVVARNNSILKQLVLQAKKEYEAEAVHRIQIYFADSHGSWRWTDSRHKRPMSSIVLNPGVKEMLLNDTRDFLKSEKWYADRGIPFRRGYLLYGVPGSGKSSLIHALAGALMLDIYVVSLSASWISDSTLSTLMGRVPARCILLLEDLDAAFTRSVQRDTSSTGSPNGPANKDETTTSGSGRGKRKNSESISDVNSLSLSGLLNSLDGVAAAEGRILFATTNHLERLDPALCRPGRMDVWIEFRNASRWQAEMLFRNFFPSAEADDPIPLDSEDTPLSPPPPPLTLSTPTEQATFGAEQAYPPPLAQAHSSRPLDTATLARLAKKFAESIPDEEFTVAALQGYLLKNKSRPEAAVSEAAAWVVSEREMRERLKREKEARERKEKLEREKRRKEILEREKAEKEKEEKEEKDQNKEEEDKAKEADEEEEEESEGKEDHRVETEEVTKEEDNEDSKDDQSETNTQDDKDETGSSTPSWVQVADTPPSPTS